MSTVYRRSPYKKRWEETFKETLENKELSIGEMAGILDVRRETISRWVSYFEIGGLLKTRFDGIKKMVRINEKKSD